MDIQSTPRACRRSGAIKLTAINQAKADSGADMTSKGALSIVEVEVFGAPTP